jgi:hypothetical protein
VILVSGIGLLLLTLANRFGRAVDRSRILSRELREATGPDRQRLAAQVDILYRRARLIRLSIALATTSVLLVSCLIMCLFLTTLLKLEVWRLLSALFICCLLSLVGALGAFLREINLSLGALKLELGYQKKL